MGEVLQFKEKVFKFNYKGDNYELTYPTLQESNEFAERFVLAPNKAEFVLDYLEVHGLPREKALNLQDHHIMEIVEHLTGRKKK